MLGVLAFAAAAAAAAAVVLHVVLAAPVVAATSFSPGLIQIGVHAREVAFAAVAGEVAASLTGCLTEAHGYGGVAFGAAVAAVGAGVGVGAQLAAGDAAACAAEQGGAHECRCGQGG